jgi:hypothetical protein
MLTVKERGLEEENQMLRERLAELEGGSDGSGGSGTSGRDGRRQEDGESREETGSRDG